MSDRKAVVVKKYSDRRLYDTTGRRYVNLEEIARLIRDGADLQVLDARTGQDLTRIVLTQIIVEDTRDGHALPVRLLRQLVVASDRATHDFVSWYLDTAFELYKNAGTVLRSGMSDARAAVTNPLEFVRKLVVGQSYPPSRDDAELEALRTRIRELEARLDRAGRRKSRRKSDAAATSRPRERGKPDARNV